MDLHVGLWANAAWDSAQSEINNVTILIWSPNGPCKAPAVV
jgi:hypothetical protein